MKPFPADPEIVAALQLLARANVLRQYYIRHAVPADLAERFAGHRDSLRDRIEDDCRRQMAAQLVSVMTGDPTWTTDPVGFRHCQVCESTGWVLAYADVRRALDAKT